ncbi:MAG: hypothetical protein F2868_00540 [Actinobacteria bacterium]|uniref:Regulator of SigK n=1 Tax=freshwater metagenome TaxID=449393 RepID=A0A6J7LYC5_9ZZZZ|nr:hypothetical protein [Actinomycetota bacterium]
MIDHELHHLAASYALDALDPDEREAFESHLAECEVCHIDVAQLRTAATGLAEAQSVAPPPALRARVLDEITRTRQQSPLATRPTPVTHPVQPASPVRRIWMISTLAAAAAMALLVVAISVFGDHDRTDSFAGELAKVMEQPDAQMLELDAQPGGAGQFKVAWSNSLHRAVLIGEGLAPAPAGKAYELWLITAEQSMAMHVLDRAADGNVHVTLDAPQMPAKWAITVEPAAGAEVATGDVIFIASV